MSLAFHSSKLKGLVIKLATCIGGLWGEASGVEGAEASREPGHQLPVALASLLWEARLLRLCQSCWHSCSLPKELAGLPGRVERVPSDTCPNADMLCRFLCSTALSQVCWTVTGNLCSAFPKLRAACNLRVSMGWVTLLHACKVRVRTSVGIMPKRRKDGWCAPEVSWSSGWLRGVKDESAWLRQTLFCSSSPSAESVKSISASSGLPALASSLSAPSPYSRYIEAFSKL